MVFRAAVAVVLGMAVIPASASAQTSSDFYREKRITLIVGSVPGGGYDTYGRILSRHYGRFLGHSTITVQYMPGAGSLIAANYLFRQAPHDGTTIGAINQGLVLNQAFKYPGVEFDLGKFNWLGRLATSVEMTVAWNPSPVSTIEEAKTRELILGAASANGSSAGLPRVMNAIVGTKFKIIPGYGGMGPIGLAIERKEVQGGHTTINKLLTESRDWLTENKVSILVQYSQARHPELYNVPTMVEFGKTEEDRQILSIFGSMADIGRTLLAPPGTEKERVTDLRTSFDTMVADKEFLADVAKMNLEFQPLSGEALQRLVETTFNVSPAAAQRAEKAWSGKE